MICSGCPLGTGPVVGGEGPQLCRIMVIGEAPGYHEAKQGRPFVGPAGEFLELCLAEARWKREDIYISNLVACRPPGNRVPTVAERRACRPRLDAEIASRKPQVILLLGATAIADFLPGVALKAHHGLPQGRYVPMFHPAAALHRPGLRAALLADWRRLPGLLEAPQQPDTKWAVVPGKMVPLPGLVAVDTETDGDRLLVVSASWQPGVAIIAPQIDLSGDHLVLFHNAKFDIKVLGQVPPKMADTMIAAFLCGEQSLGLKVLAHRRLGVQMQRLGPLLEETTDLMLAEYLAQAQALELTPKQRKSLQAVLEAKDQTTALNRRHGLRKVIGEPPSATVADVQRLLPQKFYSYSAADADMTLRLWPGLLQEMKEKKAEHLFWDIEMPLVPVLAKMEQRGLAIDRSRAREVRADLAHKRDEIGQRLQRQLGLENPASPLQVAHALFEVLGLPMLARTESGAPSTAKWVLETLNEEEPLAGDILDYRHYSKLIGTYLDPWIATEGRIHAEFNQVRQFDDDTAEGATATGRLSSSGPNLQNVPIRTPEGQAVRSCVVAESGLLYAFDYSQIELLLMALDAEDEEMLRIFREGGDLHQETADLLGVDRFVGKTINFAWGYGVRAGRLAQALTLGGRRTNRQEAERLLVEFERRRPKLRQWWNHRAALARSRGYEETFWGRRRYVPDLVMAQSEGERYEAAKKAVNHRSQGTAADICKAALVAVEALLQRHGVRPGLVCVVHDELLVEGALTPELQRGIIKAMLAPAKIPLLKVEVKCGLNWGEMENLGA